MKVKTISYWIVTGFVAIVFLVSGVGNIMRFPHIVQDMAHLGYPPYFHTILGTWKVLGAVAVSFPKIPRLKEWAYAGMIFDLTGAAFSRFASGDNVITVIIPLLIACLVVTSMLLRSQDAHPRHSAV